MGGRKPQPIWTPKALENERTAPVREQRLTIGGPVEREVHTEKAEQLEATIKNVRARLEISKKARREFNSRGRKI